jgi:hypothetical protein
LQNEEQMATVIVFVMFNAIAKVSMEIIHACHFRDENTLCIAPKFLFILSIDKSIFNSLFQCIYALVATV